MAYEGEQLTACGVLQVDLSEVSVVSVSGTGPNVCGHLILYTPSTGGYYFHVAGEAHSYPRYMTEEGYRRYLKENGKTEYRRVAFTLPQARAAERCLEQLLSQKWRWLVLPHNCVVFCETIIQAGGRDWGSYSNCPIFTTDVPQAVLNQLMNSLESEIRGLYGIPR